MDKSPDAFRTISEVAEELDVPQHVLRFWETRFAQIKPLKRGGGRRYYRPEDVELLRAIRRLLYGEGYTIRGVQRILKEQGPKAVAAMARAEGAPPPRLAPAPSGDDADDLDVDMDDALAAAGDDDPDSVAIRPAPPSARAAHDPAPPSLSAAPALGAQAHLFESPAAASPRAVGAAARAELEAALRDIEDCRRILAAARGG